MPDDLNRVGLALQIVARMNTVERADFMNRADELKYFEEVHDPKKVAYARKEAAAIAKISGGKTRKRPYWMRTAEAFDEEAVGANKVMGDWVKDVTWIEPGEFVTVGLRFPQKRYAICQRDEGSEAVLFEDVRPEFPVKIEGLRRIEEFEMFGELVDWARDTLPAGGASTVDASQDEDEEDEWP